MCISPVTNTLESYESSYSPSSYEQIVRQNGLFNLGKATGLGEEKLNLGLEKDRFHQAIPANDKLYK